MLDLGAIGGMIPEVVTAEVDDQVVLGWLDRVFSLILHNVADLDPIADVTHVLGTEEAANEVALVLEDFRALEITQ